MTKPRILCFAGSARTDSLSKKIATHVTSMVNAAGVQTTLIDLADYEMPLYNGDLEALEGLPPAAVKLRAVFAEHHGLCIVTPEYNGFFPALLKNTFDWISRPSQGVPMCHYFQGKVAGLISSSSSPFGGARALPHLRAQMADLGCVVTPTMAFVAAADKAISEDGTVTLSPPASDFINMTIEGTIQLVRSLENTAEEVK